MGERAAGTAGTRWVAPVSYRKLFGLGCLLLAGQGIPSRVFCNSVTPEPLPPASAIALVLLRRAAATAGPSACSSPRTPSAASVTWTAGASEQDLVVVVHVWCVCRPGSWC